MLRNIAVLGLVLGAAEAKPAWPAPGPWNGPYGHSTWNGWEAPLN